MFQHKRVWIKKATGLGITEFYIYFMLWLALCRPRGLETWLAGSHMVIVTGPREETAIKIIKRAKDKLEAAGIQHPYDAKETVIKVGDITIQAFPSFNASWRGIDKISLIICDESDFFAAGEQEEVRAVAERYIGKSQAWIALVSTPNKPGGLFERIEHEEPSLYYRLKLDYTYGLGKIYTEQDIAEARKSPQFGREYEGKYLGLIGNCFSETKIQSCIDDSYDPEKINPYAIRSIGVDVGWGQSSPFGIVAMQFSGNRIQVLYAEEPHNPDFNVMLDKLYSLYREIDPSKVVIDGSAADVVATFKGRIGERVDYLKQRAEYRSQGRDWELAAEIKVLPLYFGRRNKEMLTHTKNMIDNGYVSIHSRFSSLFTYLRTAYEKEGIIDKDRTAYHDVGDAFQMALWYFRLQ